VTHAISDDGGVICAFALAPVVSRVDRVGKEGIEGQPHWLHLNLGNAKARRWLEARTDIPQPARELVLESSPRIQGMVLPDGLAVVLGDVGHDLSANQEKHLLRV
jgi:hypothetical protein